MICFRTTRSLILFSLLLMASPVMHARDLRAYDQVYHIRCEANDAFPDNGVQTEGVRSASVSAGNLIAPAELLNKGSWQFDGRHAIAYAMPSNTNGFSENFTWEGFFLSPSSNSLSPETGITDRLVTQFAFDKGDWTRLAIGLVADRNDSPRLCIELEGFEGRSFGEGDRIVSADRWHHFALVHEGTPAAAKIRWYLDYKLTGELFLGGQLNQNTLRPPGSASVAIGARLKKGQEVNRGFEGFVDEVRLVPRPLAIDEFLRVDRDFSETFDDSAQLDEQQRDNFWSARHAWARSEVNRWADIRSRPTPIDAFFDKSGRRIDDSAFLRRLSLTVRGRIPTLNEVSLFLVDRRPDKRSRAIDRMLGSPEWADGWVGYWQDVLAENPSVVFPRLNNSGAFRQWIYESFRDNKPFDRFATELLLMEEAEPEIPNATGFALATGNDAPMAMRAHVAMKAFAAVDLKCARCHDSPIDEFKQSELFLLAAYLGGDSLTVPASSVAAAGKAKEPGIISTSLAAGQVIRPASLISHWLNKPEKADALKPIHSGNPRAELAALLTSPRNSRFSDVIVNRLWQRYFGDGLIESVDRWDADSKSARTDVLHVLSARFVESGYDLKALAREILTSEHWQTPRDRRQRMSAEQLVDSLFVAVGKNFRSETLGIQATDPGAVQLPPPQRAWQFAALPNERDRPALGMPVNQTIVDVLTAFGWTGSRQQPRSVREETTSALQPLMIFNGLMSQRIVRLSEQSAITEICLQNIPVSTLVDQLFVTVLGRLPDAQERQRIVAFLGSSYEQRLTGKPARPQIPLSSFQPDWRKHLEPEQTRLMLEAQQQVARGEPPTARLTTDFRERVEDVLWALINSPEFVVIP